MRREGGDMEQDDEKKCSRVLNGFCSLVEFNLGAFSVSLDQLNQRGFRCHVVLRFRLSVCVHEHGDVYAAENC